MEACDERLQTARRHFFKQCGYGVGKIALASLLGGSMERKVRAADALPANPLAARPPHYVAQGQERNPPVHGRRPQPARLVRLQAEVGGVRRQIDTAGDDRRTAIRLHPSRRRSARSAVQVRPARPERRRVVGNDAAVSNRGRRHLHHSLDAHRSVQSRSGADFSEHRLFPARPAVHGVVGVVRPGRRNDTICPRLWSCRPAPASAAARRTGRADFCRRSIPACACATKAIRS